MTQEEREEQEWQARNNGVTHTAEDRDKMSVADWAKLMDSDETSSNPGTVDLGIRDNAHRHKIAPEKPFDDYTEAEWSAFMDEDGGNSHAVNLFD